jgi:HK97 family phage prohead protease
MPYYITQTNPDCPNWAVEKEDGESVGCHDSKESAIDQAVAISIDEGTEFVGERAAIGSLAIDDYVSWAPLDPKVAAQIVMVEGQFAVVRLFDYEDGIFEPTDKLMVINVFQLEKIPTPKMIAFEVEELDEPDLDNEGEANLPDNYRPALSEDVPEGRACGNCFFFDESRVNADGDKAWCERWDAFVDGGNYCNTWQPNAEDRAINQEAPAYMRAAARRGLEYYEEGLAGDGVTPGTIREAREMAEGRVSDDKWIRIAAWIARHLVDLDSPDANPDSDNYPSAGVVAHLLWGSGPTKRAAQRTKDYADSVVARIRQEETNSMDNKNKWLDVARAIALKIDGPQPVPDQLPPDPKAPEIRTNSVDFEVRAEGDGMTFTGYASVFNSPSEDLGGFIEYVAPGAFKRSLQSRNEVKLLWNHDSGEPLASLRGGTMQLVEDNRGLKVTAQLPNTTRGRDIAELLRTKVIDSMSFGFNVIRDSWASDGKTRTLESVRLFEVSIVSFPAYEATVAQVRSAPTINPDELADALLKLESGEELDDKSAELITDVVAKLKAQPEIEEVIDNGLDLLDLKKKQFDLLLKRI